MKKYENPALVIGGGVNGLGVIRNLGKNGIDVYCLSNNVDEALYSKYCKKYFVVPNVERDFKKLINFLSNFSNEINKQIVLFPTSDISAFNVSQIINTNKQYLSPTPKSHVLEILIDKKNFYNSLKKYDVSHPKTILLNENTILEDINKEISFPAFIKPSSSQLFSKKFGKKGFIVNNIGDIEKYVNITEKSKIEIVIQEIIPGPPTNHFFVDGYIDKKYRPNAFFCRQRLRMWPPSFGNSTISVSIPASDLTELKTILIEYLNKINFSGIFNAEFKIDPRDNIPKLIEINARSWWYNYFPTKCGLNIILKSYLDMIDYSICFSEEYDVGRKYVYFIQDLKWAFAMILQNNLSFHDWLNPLTKKKDWAIFEKGDLKPFIASVLKMIEISFSNPKNVLKIYRK